MTNDVVSYWNTYVAQCSRPRLLSQPEVISTVLSEAFCTGRICICMELELFYVLPLESDVIDKRTMSWCIQNTSC